MRVSLLFNLLAAVGVLAVLIFGTTDSRAAFELVRASGALSLSNSKEGAAILSGTGLRPGQRASGSVTIGNPGSAKADLALEVGAEGAPAHGRLGPAVDLCERRRAGRLRGPGRRLRPRRPWRAARGHAPDLHDHGLAPGRRQRAPGRAAVAALHLARPSRPVATHLRSHSRADAARAARATPAPAGRAATPTPTPTPTRPSGRRRSSRCRRQEVREPAHDPVKVQAPAGVK